MRKKWVSVVGVCFLATAGFLGCITLESDVVSAGTTWYVGSGPGNDSATIGYAIETLANSGDTVFVHSGVYNEEVWINKTITLIGEDRNTTMIDGSGGIDKVVWLESANWVNITGFTIRYGAFGVYIVSSSYVRIQGNEIYSNAWDGFFTQGSSNSIFTDNIVHGNSHGFYFCEFNNSIKPNNNLIKNNVIYNNHWTGIYFEGDPWNNWIINNTIYDNSPDGIFISPGTNNSIIGNIVHHNGLGSILTTGGIHIISSANNTIGGNLIYNNQHGIILGFAFMGLYSDGNTIVGNTVYNNDNAGIRLEEASDNTFIENSIFNNDYNIYMEQQSRGNNFINCTLSNSSIDDFYLTDDSHATVLNTTFKKTSVYYGDTISTLTVKWFMHVQVMNYNGPPVSNADIWVNDSYGTAIYKGQADSNGWVRWLVVTEYLEQDMNGDNTGERTYFTPHNVTATDGSLWGRADPNMDISKVVFIILRAPSPLLPPKNLTTKVVNNGANVELEWDPPASPVLDHYLIYRADSATEFDFSAPYNSSTTWFDPKSTTWTDPDPGVTGVDDDFYYIVRAANSDESDISATSNTAGVWTRTFELGISTFSLPLEPFEAKDTEFYCQDMNASYIRWMNTTTHTWMRHEKGAFENITLLELGEGYEVEFDGQTIYTFCGMPGAMIVYDEGDGFSRFYPDTEAKNITVFVDVDGNVTLTWQEPSSMTSGDWYEVYYSNTRGGFFGTFGMDYDIAGPPIGFGNNTTIISGLGAANPGARLYFMLVPFNSSGVRGSSTYSIGVWTEEYLGGYDTIGIPLKLSSYNTADWFCDNIPDTVGINYYIYDEQRWGWHSTLMPEGAFDVILEMGVGYQISTLVTTKFTFIGF